jgi:zinc/manganese transport system substrate-binding protein
MVAAVLGSLFSMTIAHAKLNVVATTPEFAAIARAIGGDKIEVATIAKPTEDPHFVDAKPSHIVKLNRADALIEGGAELEIGWLPPLLEGARNPKLDAGKPGRIACAKGVSMLEVPATLDRSKGDIHAAGNPHYMMDPVNGKIAGQTICDAFCQLDSQSCNYYRANLAKFEERLDVKLAEWQKLMAPYQGKRVVAYHNSWVYFSQRFGLKIDLFLEPKPGIPPTPANLANVIATMKSEKIHVILCEPHLNHKTAQTVAADTGAVLVEFTQYPGGVKGTEGGYIEMMDYLVNTVAKALGAEASRTS